MPIYEYVCEDCGEEFEHIQRFTDNPLKKCPCEKKAPVIRKLSLSAFQLKGGGWYKEGYGGSAAKAEGSKPDVADSSRPKKKDEGKSSTNKKENTSASKSSASSA